MSPLNYLGSSPGPGITMPAGMPGTGAPEDPTLSAASAQSMMAAQQAPPPMGMPPGGAGMPPGAAGGPFGMGGVGMVDPAGRQYEAVTQEDGSVLLHLKNPDGSKGPAVKIIPPIKPRNPGA